MNQKRRHFQKLMHTYTPLRKAWMMLALIGVWAFVGCDQVDQFTTPGAPDTIKIGLVLELPSQITTQYGAQLAVAQINQEGGVLGFPLELVVKSNDDDPVRSAQVAEELITQDNVAALIGPNFSRNAIEVGKVAQRLETPLVATTATNPMVTAAGNFVFLAAFSDNFQGEVMARFAREELNAQTAALLAQAEELYSTGLSDIFEANFTALGGTIVAREFYAGGDTDFTAPLTAIADQAPDVIFMPGFVPEVPLAAKQARTIPQRNAAGITATFLGADGWDDPDLVPMGDKAIEGGYFSNLFAPETQDETGREFVRAYRSMFGITPDGLAAMGYDALRLVATAMRRAGAADKAAVRDQIAATRGYKGATSLLSYDENRHPTKSAVILTIQDGRVRFHQQVEP